MTRRRILLVTPFAPSARPLHGGARAISGLARALAERHELHVLHCDAEVDVDPELAPLFASVHRHPPPAGGRATERLRAGAALASGRRMWAGALGVAALGRRTAELVRELHPAVVQAEFAVVGEALAAAEHGLRVVTIHDPAERLRESLAERREGAQVAHRLDVWAAQRQERRVLRAADAAVVFTEADRRAVAAGAPAGVEIATIPLGAELPPAPLDPLGSSPPTVVFVGAFRHPPNVDAARALAERILPRVHAMRRDVRLEIVGDGPPPELRALQSETVTVTGRVESVIPHLDRAAVVAAPVRIGGGMRVKILEALAAGKAIVATALAAEGVGVRDGHELVIAESDDAIAAAIVRLVDDEASRRTLAQRARAWAERELPWSVAADRYDALYARLAERGSSTRR
jgi:polysaccharide biosynthesis protein PslH